MIKPFKQIYGDCIFAFVMVLFYLSEGFSKYFYHYSDFRISFPKNIKTIVLVILVLFLIFKKKWFKLSLITFLITFFFIGQYFISTDYFNKDIISILTKYIFPLLLFESAFLYFNKNNRKIFFKTFELIIIINFLLILLGLFFNIDMLKTYGPRFGFNGLFITSATSTYFYIIAVFYLYLIRNKSKYFLFLSVITIISSVLIGTKSNYLFLMLFAIFIAIYQIAKKYRIKAILIAFTLIVLLTISFFIFEPSHLILIKERGLLTSILSYRDDLLVNRTMPFINEKWNLINYFFGGIDNTLNRSQLGFFDLILTFGIVGSSLYLYAYYKSLFKTKLNKNALFILVSLSLIIALGGNFFFSATIIIYLTIIQQILIEKNSL